MARGTPCVIIHLPIDHFPAHVLASSNLCWIFYRVGSAYNCTPHRNEVLIIRSVCLLGFFCGPLYPLVTRILVLACDELANKVRF